MPSLPVKLRALRAEKDWTVREAAEKIGTTVDNLSRIERGLIGPPPNFVLDKLAAAIGVERAVLYNAAGRLPPDDEEARRGVVEAIMADPSLTEEQKAYLVQGFRLLQGKNQPAP